MLFFLVPIPMLEYLQYYEPYKRFEMNTYNISIL